MPNTQAVQQWLDRVQVIDDEGLRNLSVGDRASLESLLGHDGMKQLLGLMLGARQGLLVQLAAMPLHTAEAASRASVTQGKIQGIDLLWQTLLELTTPATDTNHDGATSND